MKFNKHLDLIDSDNTVKHKANKRARARYQRKQRKLVLRARRARGQSRTGKQ